MEEPESRKSQPQASRPDPISRLSHRIHLSRSVVEIAIAFVLIFLVMAWIQFGGPAILDNDGYYHIRWAAMLRENFPHLPSFRALPLTTLNEKNYVDHHYLFHILLIPFTFGDLRVGAKLAAVVFSSLGISSIFGLLVTYRVRYRWLWLPPLLAGSEHFLYRLSMTRAPALSLALIAAATYLILKRKHIWLGVLAFVFVWSYSLFPLVLLFALAYSLSVYLAERRIDFRGALASLIGIVAGLVINPYFPKNLVLLREHFLMKSTSTFAVDVGVEWYPYESWDLLQISAIAFVIYLAALLAFSYRDRVRDLKPLFFLIVSLVLLLLTFKSRRFIEYWPPFAVLFAAFTFGPRIESMDLKWFAAKRDRVIAAIAGSAIALAAAIWMGVYTWQARQDIKSELHPFAYRGASEWLADNAPPNSMIFNTDWDDFPMLFYYNPTFTYIVGLDPTYLYDKAPDLWKTYKDITLGDEEHPANLIRDMFGASYVFTDNEHQDFMQIAMDSGDFEVVYEDEHATVLRVRAPNEPRPQNDESNQ